MKIFNLKTSTRFLLLLMAILIIVTRLLVFNADGANFFPDEWRYFIQITNIDQAVKTHDLIYPIKRIYDINARPGFAVFYGLPALFERYNPNIPFGLIFNLLVNLLQLLLVFLIVKRIENIQAAFLSVTLVTLSMCSVFYLRHLIPWDLELTLLLLAFYIYLKTKKAFLFGIFCGIAFFTYPSFYYYLLPVPLLLLVLDRKKQVIKRPFLFILGLGLILILAQLFSNLIGATDYFYSLKAEGVGARTVEQGDYIPAWDFLREYILSSDGIWFLVISCFPILGIFFIKKDKKILLYALYLVLIFLILELTSHIFKTLVLYGRTARPFYLVLLAFSGIILNRFLVKFSSEKKYLYWLALVTIIFITFLSWLPRFLSYKNLIYPNQFKREARFFLNPKAEQYKIEDTLFVDYWDTKTPDPKILWHFFKPGEPGKYYTVNAIFLYPYFGNYDLKTFCNFELVYSKSHTATSFPPYLLEGHKRVMREKMISDPLEYKLIYCK